METDKNKLIASAIAIVLQQKEISVEHFANNPVPMNFWPEVHKALPEDQKLDIKAHLIDRWSRKNKAGVQTNKIRILGMLGYQYADNANNESMSFFDAPRPSKTQHITETEIRKIVEEEIDKRLSGPSAIVHNEHTELCPESDTISGEGKGRRLQRKYDRVSITIDSELWKLFRAEQKRLHTTAPRLMDSILWIHYGKPKLSFE